MPDIRRVPGGYRLLNGDTINQLIDRSNGTTESKITGTFNGIIGDDEPGTGSFTGVSSETIEATTSLSSEGTLDVGGAANFAGAEFSLSSIAVGLTAHAGGGQGSALQLAAAVNIVSVVATTADSVKLPQPSVAGQLVLVSNTSANSMQVFGAGTATIDAIATATGKALAAGKSAWYVATTAGAAAAWRTVIGA